MIEQRHKKYKEEIHSYISNKLENERKKYNESLDKFILKQKELELRQKERAFIKMLNNINIIYNIYL